MENNIKETSHKDGVRVVAGIFQEIPDISKTPPVPTTTRTMKNDVVYAITNQKETLVSIALGEEKKRLARSIKNATKMTPVAETPAPKKITGVIVVSVIILILAGLAWYKFLMPKLSIVNPPGVLFSNFKNTTK